MIAFRRRNRAYFGLKVFCLIQSVTRGAPVINLGARWSIN
ncbi:hypothetical protein PSP31120_02478 [Pandoraea sputorum]|nr:hypothetical protein PSP31120_02478 [Pandoraea sputorum]